MPVVAVLVGSQASGKTTFCRDVLGAGYVPAVRLDGAGGFEIRPGRPGGLGGR